MVVVQLPDGSTGEYALDDSDRALRLVTRCASFDLMTALTELGWRILDVTTDRDRERMTVLALSRRLLPPCQQHGISPLPAPRSSWSGPWGAGTIDWWPAPSTPLASDTTATSSRATATLVRRRTKGTDRASGVR